MVAERASIYVGSKTDLFWEILHLNSPCNRKRITLMFIEFLERSIHDFTVNEVTGVLLVYGHDVDATHMDTNMASPYKAHC